MSSVGSNNVAFWASSDAVAAEIVVSLRRARFLDMTHVDMEAASAGRTILGSPCSDGRW